MYIYIYIYKEFVVQSRATIHKGIDKNVPL